jgi:hypothetical protein
MKHVARKHGGLDRHNRERFDRSRTVVVDAHEVRMHAPARAVGDPVDRVAVMKTMRRSRKPFGNYAPNCRVSPKEPIARQSHGSLPCGHKAPA